MRMPVLFISHESPYLWDTASPARSFLSSVSTSLSRPKAIVVISAHWLSKTVQVSSAPKPNMIYDFGGFPAKYRNISYQAPGSQMLAEDIVNACESQGIKAAVDPGRGFDHAVWIPLGLMYPTADIPVVCVSVQPSQNELAHLSLGQVLQPLRDEGVLIIGSGTATHNLTAFLSDSSNRVAAAPSKETKGFSDWLIEKVEHGDVAAILNYRNQAPFADHCHPTAEHFLPLIVALGAGGAKPGECIHQSFNYGHFAMTAYRWTSSVI